jgi:hypothetical protein
MTLTEAWRRFVYEVAESLRVVRAVEWVADRLDRKER